MPVGDTCRTVAAWAGTAARTPTTAVRQTKERVLRIILPPFGSGQWKDQLRRFLPHVWPAESSRVHHPKVQLTSSAHGSSVRSLGRMRIAAFFLGPGGGPGWRSERSGHVSPQD